MPDEGTRAEGGAWRLLGRKLYVLGLVWSPSAQAGDQANHHSAGSRRVYLNGPRHELGEQAVLSPEVQVGEK